MEKDAKRKSLRSFVKGHSMTEYEKMLSGQLACPTDLSAMAKMARGYLLTSKLNRTSMLLQGRRTRLLKRLLGTLTGEPYYVQSPLYVEYGCNTHVGKNFLSNYNLVIMDEGPVTIGDNVMIAPNVVITTDMHPFLAEQRNVCRAPNRFPSNHRGNYVYAKPITIGNNVWLCASVTVCPGVTIGDNAVIGAGSVVTRDIPANVLAFGVPCRVVREITEADRMDGFYPEREMP